MDDALIKQFGLESERYGLKVCGFCGHENYLDVRNRKFAELVAGSLVQSLTKELRKAMHDRKDTELGLARAIDTIRAEFGV